MRKPVCSMPLLPVIPEAILVLFLLLLTTGCRKMEALPVQTSAGVSNVSALSSTTGMPNVILILIDDMGYEIPTCNGGQSYSTPNMDLMAAEGMRLTQCDSSP